MTVTLHAEVGSTSVHSVQQRSGLVAVAAGYGFRRIIDNFVVVVQQLDCGQTDGVDHLDGESLVDIAAVSKTVPVAASSVD